MSVEKQHPKDVLLTPEYYTRFQVWQGLVKQLDGLQPTDIADLAEQGWKFIWQDDGFYTLTEEDKEKEKEETDSSRELNAYDIKGGTYL